MQVLALLVQPLALGFLLPAVGIVLEGQCADFVVFASQEVRGLVLQVFDLRVFGSLQVLVLGRVVLVEVELEVLQPGLFRGAALGFERGFNLRDAHGAARGGGYGRLQRGHLELERPVSIVESLEARVVVLLELGEPMLVSRRLFRGRVSRALELRGDPALLLRQPRLGRQEPRLERAYRLVRGGELGLGGARALLGVLGLAPAGVRRARDVEPAGIGRERRAKVSGEIAGAGTGRRGGDAFTHSSARRHVRGAISTSIAREGRAGGRTHRMTRVPRALTPRLAAASR